MAKVTGASSKGSLSSASRTGRSARRRSTGTKRTASGGGRSRSNGSSTDRRSRASDFVVCLDDAGNDDLQALRIYRTLPDPSAFRSKLLRVVDDSGEGYLYPSHLFVSLRPSPSLRA